VNRLLLETTLPGGARLQLVRGDITAEATEAIVNAANEYLEHGGGVAGAIARAGGPAIQAESDAWVRAHGPVSHAEPAWTSGGRLPCRYVIHAVGPVWGDGNEDAKLGEAVDGSLRVAEELKLTSISFPAISTGIFGFPRERAAQVMLRAIQGYFEAALDSHITVVRLALFDAAAITAFEKAWHDHFDA
jgi:O-acetyl-ADP-ribose deacetylase (regulator of RNase III)